MEEQVAYVRKLATEIQQQGERAALAGLLEQATAHLAQIWAITQEYDPDRANAAAWEAGWLGLRMRLYDEAAKWFGRVAAVPSQESRLWPAARQALVQLCLELEHGSMESAVMPEPSPPVQPATLRAPSASSLPLLRVMNLGRFQVVRAETVLPPCTAHKAITIFRYLLSRRHRAARKEELLELLWPDMHPQSATHSLHVAVSTLRRYLDPPTGSYLRFEDGLYTITPDAPIENDVADFEQCVDAAERYRRASDLVQAQQAYINAITCYQGDYYVDDQYLTWAIAEQERLLTRYLSALDHLGQICIAQRQFEQAIAYYQRLLERDSYREDVHCQLMRCYLQLGWRCEALRQYERCTRILATDLGLQPMQTTQALYHAIVKHNGPPDALFA
jgi:DNA-binding SARP family transcriptional activator